MNILYTIIIYPIQQIIELFYYLIYWIFKNHGLSICGISIAVSVLTLPLYLKADKMQQKERELQKSFKPKIDRIKSTFAGDDQYFLISTFYRQNKYHPIFMVRSSLGLLIQVPFFIAAYSFLSTFNSLSGVNFFIIKDLSKPDGLLSLFGISFNILPILMTIINCFSAFLYSKGFQIREKFQLYLISLIFLVLLYFSPSGLVLYWTMNNLFSLGKNIFQKIKNSKKLIICLLVLTVVIIDLYLIFVHHGKPITRLFITIVATFLFLSIIFIVIFYNKLSIKSSLSPYKISLLYFISIFVLFVLSGIVIPSSLISSSVREFSFIDQYSSPLPFIFNTSLQALGFFVFWPGLLYLLFSVREKIILSFIVSSLCIISLFNTFIIKDKFGFLTTTMTFSEPSQFQGYNFMVILNVFIILLIFSIVLFIFRNKKIKLLYTFQSIVLISLIVYGLVNIGKIQINYSKYKIEKMNNSSLDLSGYIQPVYNLSKNGKNVVLIMADNFVSGFLPNIFKENPRVAEIFTGWKYYPNNISYGNHTLVGSLPIYGGYEYTPEKINKNKNITLLEKQTEAYLLLPRIFYNAGFSVVVTDPPFDNYLETNLGIFKNYPEIITENISGKYTNIWMQKNPEITGIVISDILKRNLLYFSFFRCAPVFVRLYIYDLGDWLSVRDYKDSNGLTKEAIDHYALFDSLTELTNIVDSKENTFLNIYEPLPHNDFILQYPDYTPSSTITDKGPSAFANENFYHVDTASILLLGKWLTYLKNNNVYDNTRIILVSDHGRGNSKKINNIRLPSGQILQSYNSILMFKDFNSKGKLVTDNTFMTNADVPLLLTSDLITKPVNPFTNIELTSDKENGATITTIGALSSRVHTKYLLKIDNNQWLHVNNNIFDSKNWSVINPQF